MAIAFLFISILGSTFSGVRVRNCCSASMSWLRAASNAFIPGGEPTGSARFYGWRGRRCVGTEVLFVNNAIPGDHESLDPRQPVLRGIGHQNQATFLIAAGNIAIGSSRRISIHESKVVSVEGSGVIAVSVR